MPWFIRRIVVAVFLAWTVITSVAVTTRFIPAPASDLQAQLGLNRPFPGQYAHDLGRLIAGDFGNSLRDGTPVGTMIAVRLPRTLELLALAGLLALLAGVPGGLFAGMRRNGTIDGIGATLSDAARALPAFALGTVLLVLTGVSRTNLVLPAVTLAVGLGAVVFRATRAATADIARSGSVRMARGMGLVRARVLLNHVLRNALTPVIATLARYVGALTGATIMVEYVFSFPGIAGYLVEAVSERDYPQIEGIVLTMALLSILASLTAHLLRGALDPRERAA